MSLTIDHQIVTFGLFEVDLDAAEIRKAGLRVRLSGQPYRLLITLLARPGEVVARDVLHREIWGENVNVDFERGLASAVNKVRDALGDAADHPIYIETVARKGYRFIAPVSSTPRFLPEEVVAPKTEREAEPDHGPVAIPNNHHGELTAVETFITLPSTAPSVPTRTVPIGLPRPKLLWSVAACVLGGVTMFIMGRTTRVSPPLVLAHVEQLTQTNDVSPGPPNQETLLSLVTDGPRIYVPTLVSGRPQLASFETDGTYRQLIALPSNLGTGAVTDISQEGTRLLIRSRTNREPEQPLWVVPTSGAGAQRVGDVQGHDAAWVSHDSDHILYATGNELREVELGSGGVRPVVSLPGRAFWLRWSPDGRLLRFTLFNSVLHSSQIWQMDWASHELHQVKFEGLSTYRVCCGSWNASGKQFIFQVTDTHSSNLWLANSGTHSGLTQLTNGPIRFYSPLLSRDSSTIFAFGSAQPDAVQRYDRDRHEFVPVDPYLQHSQRVAFSRDGAWAAWTDSSGHLWRARAKTGEDLLQLTGDNVEVFSARWSPDGSRLVLMARYPGRPWQIYGVNAVGGAVTPLMNDERNLADPDWSPDGQRLVFGREPGLMGEEQGPHDIGFFELATGHTQILPGSKDLFSPRWSPDGRWIAALSHDQSRLLLYEVSTQQWKTLYTGSAADPEWSTDSQSVVFHAFSSDHPAILQVSIGGTVQTVIDLTKLGPLVSSDCFLGGVAPDGSPLIKPHAGAGNLYSITMPVD